MAEVEDDQDGESLFPSLLLVVRGGMCTPESLARAALTCQRRNGEWGISFWSWPDMAADEIAMRAYTQAIADSRPNPLPYPVIRSTVGTELPGVAEGEASLRQTIREGHYTYTLPLPIPPKSWNVQRVFRVYSEWWTATSNCMGEPQDNPAQNRGKT